MESRAVYLIFDFNSSESVPATIVSDATEPVSATVINESSFEKVIEEALLIFKKSEDPITQYIFTTFGKEDKKFRCDCTF